MAKPIKSRHGLTRCSACRAHIQASERPSATVCPFCGANLRTGRPLISLPSGRGGLLAASLLAFGAAACGGTDASEAESEVIVGEPAQTGDEGPGGGTAQNQNEPTEPSYAPSEDPVAVEAYGAPPPEQEPPPPEPESEPEDGDGFQERPSHEHRPAPRYGLAPSLRDRPLRPDDPLGGLGG